MSCFAAAQQISADNFFDKSLEILHKNLWGYYKKGKLVCLSRVLLQSFTFYNTVLSSYNFYTSIR